MKPFYTYSIGFTYSGVNDSTIGFSNHERVPEISTCLLDLAIGELLLKAVARRCGIGFTPQFRQRSFFLKNLCSIVIV